jgi:photosystem II stability/assembly factor-like uncharacterized protein
MKMESVQEQLTKWGELIITTDAGETYEIHLGDTKYNSNQQAIILTTPEAEFIIDGDAVENV